MNRTLTLAVLALAAGCGPTNSPQGTDGNSDAAINDPLLQLEAETGHPWTVRWREDIHTPALLEGKTEEEVIALKPLADLDATWARNPQDAIGNTRNIYNSFKRS